MGWSTAALVACGLTLTLGAVCASAVSGVSDVGAVC